MTRDSRAGRRRHFRRNNDISKQWASHPIAMLQSPAWRVLSLAARRLLDRVAIELAAHGGRASDKLPVTFADFEEYGIRRHSIKPAIREAVALGFLRITRQGRAGNAEFRRASCYQSTYLNNADGPAAAPTHDWKRITTLQEARAIAAATR